MIRFMEKNSTGGASKRMGQSLILQQNNSHLAVYQNYMKNLVELANAMNAVNISKSVMVNLRVDTLFALANV